MCEVSVKILFPNANKCLLLVLMTDRDLILDWIRKTSKIYCPEEERYCYHFRVYFRSEYDLLKTNRIAFSLILRVNKNNGISE